jgi:Fe-coproporphyrin III synthase
MGERGTEKKETFTWGNAEISIEADGLPGKLYVELSSRCNFSCKGCFRESFDTEGEDMSPELFDPILETIDQKNGVKEIMLGGIGEPLLHPSFKKFVERAGSAGAKIDLQTNGSLLSREMIAFLVSQGVNKVVLSYETGALGHAADIAGLGLLSENATLPGFPAETVRFIREERKRQGVNRPTVAVQWVLSSQSAGELESFADAALESGVEEVLFSNYLPVSEGGSSELLYRFQSGEIENRILEPFLQRVRHRLHYVLPRFSLPTERSCRFMEQKSTVIRSDGEVVPCYRLMHKGCEVVRGKAMELHAYSFGSLYRQSLEEIWNSRDYIWFRFSVENGYYPSCLDCTLREGCEYLVDSDGHCWGGAPSCGNCLWSRQILLCP